MVVFWIVLSTLLFIYIGYPFCLYIATLFSKKKRFDESHLPSVSLIIPVHNEEAIIERKIKNSLNLDYPKGKLEVIVASDGSTDNTKSISERYEPKGVRFCDFPRTGKLATVNRVVPETNGEIIVLTDASAMFVADALKKIVRHFVDEKVGVVSGVERIVSRGDFISSHEESYWTYETKLKELESKIHSAVGANGPIYAIRREIYPYIPSHLRVNDDMAISLSVIDKGRTIVMEPEAIAFEDASLTLKEEWRRKVRISIGAWHTLFYHKKLLVPFKSPIAFSFIFHKLLRWLTLPFLVILLVANFFVPGDFYRLFLFLQISIYILSFVGIIRLWHGAKVFVLLTFLSYFMFTNAAQIVGLFMSIFAKSPLYWQPTKRRV